MAVAATRVIVKASLIGRLASEVLEEGSNMVDENSVGDVMKGIANIAVGTAGGVAGIWAGAEIGAEVGGLSGPSGVVLGAIIGAIAGSAVGSKIKKILPWNW
jgi:hypothetical protein